jgi:hypothetical protein
MASKLLAKHLVEVEGITPVEGVANGRRKLKSADRDGPIEQSHFWLEVGGYIVDITADQFDESLDPVIVTRDRTWHDQFQFQTRMSQQVVLSLSDFLLKKYERMQERLDRQ